MEEPVSAQHYFVEGRVQGVGFRAFVRGIALELGLRGWVRNRVDGRVEILVEGSHDSLEEFKGRVKTGPWLSSVRKVTVEEVARKNFVEFVITG